MPTLLISQWWPRRPDISVEAKKTYMALKKGSSVAIAGHLEIYNVRQDAC